MSSPNSIIEQQVSRVRRRLMFEMFGKCLAGSWVFTLVLGVVWLLAQPFLVPTIETQANWVILGAALGAATVASAVWTWRHAPSVVQSALHLDERFGLRERVTTSMTLGEQDRSSPAGTALLDDASRRVQGLRVGDRFPVTLPRSMYLVPLVATAVALLLQFYDPQQAPAAIPEKDRLVSDDPVVLAEIEKKKKLLRQKKNSTKTNREPWSEDLKDLRERSDQLSKKKTDTRDEVREAMKEMAELEMEMQKREEVIQRRVDALEEQMKQLERLSKEDPKDRLRKKKGPGEKMDDAVSRVDFDKASQEAERLARRLERQEDNDKLRKKKEEEKDRLRKKKDEAKDKEEEERLQRELDQLDKEIDKLNRDAMSDEEKDQLRQQMEDMEDKLQRLTRNREEKKEELEQLKEKGLIDQEQLDRELEELEKSEDELDEQTKGEMKKLAQALKEASAKLEQGDEKGASEKLEKAADQMAKLDAKAAKAELARQRVLLRQARKSMARAMNGQPQPATGKRPQGKEHETEHKNTKAKTEVDDMGRLEIVDFVPGQGFKKPFKPLDRADDIRRAAQHAAEAIDRQRLPRSATSMTRGYFEKLREKK